ncbi:O-antigen ligase family protein [Mycobacterium antarcticum]|uniref:O-antigen ligase family protein n=1 Tax=unclassified Mycolicibacterium TaxID=2636767 RepID=UPI0024E0CD5C|nr:MULTISPECIES: O-antigen ligase family protein [unclassified Mycolicibacterium]
MFAIRTFSTTAALLALGLLGFTAYARKANLTSTIQAGPFFLLIGSTILVLTRPAPTGDFLFFALLVALIVRLVMTINAGAIIASLVDGAGIYLALNVASYAAGVRSPGAADRIGDIRDSGGTLRILFPFSPSLEIAPTIASFYIGAAAFLVFQRGWRRRSLRLVGFAAAFAVIVQGGNRTALFAAVALPIAVILFPFIARWVGILVTVFASVSALVLPAIAALVQPTLLAFLSFIAPERTTRAADVGTLNNRSIIWRKSTEYWMNWVDGEFNWLFGFGQQGQYRSGASMSYAQALSSTVRHPELASMHNSFLQQLFDGGVIGWLLLTLAILWANVRLSRYRTRWGAAGLAAIVAMVTLLLNSMTQVSIAPGSSQDSFWLLVILIGVACQSPRHALPAIEADERKTTKPATIETIGFPPSTGAPLTGRKESV